MTRKHIALLYTGGTIGMAQTAQGYAPMPDFDRVLAGLLSRPGDELPRYTLHAYVRPIDSSNATPQDWQTIARDIAARYADYDGFVVLHGTDTMTYTASALSFMLQGLRKPVILTGSQVPLSLARSDAAQNLVTALQLAASDAIHEVAICFGQRLLRGNRATKISTERFDAFDTPNHPALATIGIHARLDHNALLPRPAVEAFELPDYPEAAVLPVRFAPGLPLRYVQSILDLQPEAVILQCYGAGNLPDRDPALLRMLGEASARGTVVVACSQAQQGRVSIGAYAVGSGMAAAGIVGAGDMTFEAIYTKLHHLLARGLAPDAVRGALARDLAGEISA
ncbi:type I asparaginase [Oxalobacteraceae bacterium OM1]|nr:type I asparaginase [Oxalobacteraceae bacterium OM1]